MVYLYIFYAIAALFLMYGGYSGFRGDFPVVFAWSVIVTAGVLGYAVGAVARHICAIVAVFKTAFFG